MMKTIVVFCAIMLCAGACAFAQQSSPAFTMVALGDAGEHGSIFRANAKILDDMRTGQHDGGRCNVLVLLGDDIGETGLNVPPGDVQGTLNGTLGMLRAVLRDVGADRVHGIPGESDYFARKAVEKTALFGLVSISEWPVGLSDRGVQRAAASDEWRFHYRFPSSARFATTESGMDSVEIIFFDSALLLRTSQQTWRPALDSLRSLLAASRRNSHVQWRIFCAHHPFVSVGEHAGYSVWNEEDSTTQYVSGCDRDSNAYGFVKNWLDPEDLCTDRYRAYIDSASACIASSGVPVQLMVSAHDRSLQVLSSGDGASWQRGVPPLQIVSGCGAQTAIAGLSKPPSVYTASQRGDHGISLGGFVQLTIRDEHLVARFFNARNGELVKFDGKDEFLIGKDGLLH